MQPRPGTVSSSQLLAKVGESEPSQSAICHPNSEGFMMNERDGPRAVELAVFTDLVRLQALRDTLDASVSAESFCNSSRTHRNQMPQG